MWGRLRGIPAAHPLAFGAGFTCVKTTAADVFVQTALEGRDLDSLRKHAESLGPSCSVDTPDKCSPEDKVKLDKFAAMSQQRRTAKLTKLQNAIKKLEMAHEALQKSLSPSAAMPLTSTTVKRSGSAVAARRSSAEASAAKSDVRNGRRHMTRKRASLMVDLPSEMVDLPSQWLYRLRNGV